MVSIKNLFSKDNRISVGDRVMLTNFGQTYIGTVMIADHSGNKYVVDYKERFSNNLRSVLRKRHQLDVLDEATIVEPEYVDYEDAFTVANMM
jgi:hypothetical protein